MENQVDIDMGRITLFKSLPLRNDMQTDAQIYQNEYTNTHMDKKSISENRPLFWPGWFWSNSAILFSTI